MACFLPSPPPHPGVRWFFDRNEEINTFDHLGGIVFVFFFCCICLFCVFMSAIQRIAKFRGQIEIFYSTVTYDDGVQFFFSLSLSLLYMLDQSCKFLSEYLHIYRECIKLIVQRRNKKKKTKTKTKNRGKKGKSFYYNLKQQKKNKKKKERNTRRDNVWSGNSASLC